MKKGLYAVAFNEYIRGTIRPDIVYLHAENQGHARFLFTQAYPQKKQLRIEIAAIGLAVGFIEEKNEKNELIIRA